MIKNKKLFVLTALLIMCAHATDEGWSNSDHFLSWSSSGDYVPESPSLLGRRDREENATNQSDKNPLKKQALFLGIEGTADELPASLGDALNNVDLTESANVQILMALSPLPPALEEQSAPAHVSKSATRLSPVELGNQRLAVLKEHFPNGQTFMMDDVRIRGLFKANQGKNSGELLSADIIRVVLKKMIKDQKIKLIKKKKSGQNVYQVL